MEKFYTFEEHKVLNEMEKSEKPLNESLDDMKIFAKKSLVALKTALKLKVRKKSPVLASNDQFMNQLAASYKNETGENVKEKEKETEDNENE